MSVSVNEGIALCIHKVPIFNHLSDETMHLLKQYARPTSLQKGELLYRSGEKNTSLYIVHKGRLNIYHLSQDGKQQLIRILKPGDFTGELTLFNPEAVHENFAEAVIDCQICVLAHEDVRQLLESYPAISIKLLEELSRRLSATQYQVSNMAAVSITQRIVMYLEGLYEAQSEGDTQKNSVVVLPMSRRELASYLGTSPESVSRKFTQLEQAGLIEQRSPRKIHIPEMKALLAYLDD